jgi:hypothetical protein
LNVFVQGLGQFQDAVRFHLEGIVGYGAKGRAELIDEEFSFLAILDEVLLFGQFALERLHLAFICANCLFVLVS